MNSSTPSPSPQKPPPRAGAAQAAAAAEKTAETARRDAGMLRMMGWFFAAFGVLVSIGVFWESELPGRIVSVASGLVLIGIGAGVGFLASRLRKRS